MTQLDSLIAQQLEFYADKAGESVSEEDQTFWVQQGLDLLNEMNAPTEEEGVFYVTYWRYESESFGVTFEQDHGDPELQFGGII